MCTTLNKICHNPQVNCNYTGCLYLCTFLTMNKNVSRQSSILWFIFISSFHSFMPMCNISILSTSIETRTSCFTIYWSMCPWTHTKSGKYCYKVITYGGLAALLEIHRVSVKWKEGSKEQGSFHVKFKFIEWKEAWLGREIKFYKWEDLERY